MWDLFPKIKGLHNERDYNILGSASGFPLFKAFR